VSVFGYFSFRKGKRAAPTPPRAAPISRPAPEPIATTQEGEQTTMAEPNDPKPTNVKREGGRVWIDNVLPAKGGGNGYMRGLECLLAYAGTPVDYDRLMALSGIAFITQADSEHRWEGQIDVGWWPLDPWGLMLRREFLEQAVGYEIQEVGRVNLPVSEFIEIQDRLPEVFREQIEPHVKRSIAAGRPMLATCEFGFVIYGYDEGPDPVPVFGRCGWETENKEYRPGTWPLGLLVLGPRSQPLDIDAADAAALRHAVSLAYDRAGPHEAEFRDRRFTGQKAFAAWSSLLRNMDEPVEDRHHANMKNRLMSNRESAVAYLRSVAERHEADAAESLRQAAATYEQTIGLLSQINPGGLSRDPAKRRELADLVDRIAANERQAPQYIEKALAAMPEPDSGR